jgi:DHA1 family tetracycline resistance protein-like MFS transporter
VIRAAGGDIAKAAAWIAYMSGGAGAFEFFVNPALGRLSDKYGRRPFILLSPIVNFILKFAVYATDGRMFSLVALERIVGGSITTVSGTTTSCAALGDLLSGPDLSAAYGQLGSAAGLGVLIGPFLAGSVLSMTKDVRHTYLLGAMIAMVQGIYNGIHFEETLTEDKRKEFSWDTCNPLSFVKIFTGDPTVAKLSLVAGLQCFPEGKSLADMNMMCKWRCFSYCMEYVW